MIGEGAPPRKLEHQVEAVLPFPSCGSFYFHTGLFSIESVNHSEDQGYNYAEEKMAPRDRNGGD